MGACALLLAAGPRPVPMQHPSLTPILYAEHSRTVTPALEAASGSANEAVAVRAILALGRTKQAAAATVIGAHLNDPRPAVRAMSVYAIGLIVNGPRDATILAAMRDSSSAVRYAALDAADRYAAAGALDSHDVAMVGSSVGALLVSDPDPLVRARTAATLVSFSSAPNASALVALLAHAVQTDRAAIVREDAMWAIFRGYAAAAPHDFELSMLHDPDEIVRIEAVRALGRRKDASDVPAVQALLGDSSWRVQEQANETLLVLTGKDMTQHMTSIPSFVHVPSPQPDPLASLPAMPRTPVSGRPSSPTVDEVANDGILWNATLDPTTAAAMSGPAPGLHPRVRVVTTQGNVYVTLFPEWAPFTVQNFLDLANRGYYDNNRWFRIVPDFVVQTGDPNDNGNGDAGYTIGAEENPIPQESYVISMGLNYTDGPNAHAIRDSAGTQYYVTLSPQLHLDRDFTVFGAVTSGFDVLGRLKESDRVVRIERVADERL